jgi:hypothetical protein
MRDFGIWETIPPEAKLTLLIARFLVNTPDTENMEELLRQQPLDWGIFNRIIAYHELSLAAHIFLRRYPNLVPQEELKLLEQCFHPNLLYLTSLRQESLKILRYLQDKNIIALPLKGAQFLLDADVYADKAYLRPMCDIDILVKKEDYFRVQGILESQGYQRELCGKKEEYWHNENYHLAFTRKSQDGYSYMVEVHWALDYPRNKPLLLPLWGRVKKVDIEGRIFYLLSSEDALFSLALHQRRFGKMLCLKGACDVVLLLTRYEHRLDWGYLIKEATLAQTRTTLYFVLVQAETLFNIQIPPVFLKMLKVRRYKKELIRNFIFKDTFGCELDSNVPYLKAHFLLYDGFKEPIKSVFYISQEQFAKFYRLAPYVFKTSILYHLRWACFIKSSIVIVYKAAMSKISIFSREITKRK